MSKPITAFNRIMLCRAIESDINKTVDHVIRLENRVQELQERMRELQPKMKKIGEPTYRINQRMLDKPYEEW